MPVFLDARGVPVCDHCGYSLCGLPTRGVCPECGEWYTCRQIVMTPGFRRARLNVWEGLKYVLWRCTPSLRVLAVLVLILGNTAIVVGLAAYAWHLFMKQFGP
jgi:hypothetical protein